jgi:hypothetical protein
MLGRYAFYAFQRNGRVNWSPREARTKPGATACVPLRGGSPWSLALLSLHCTRLFLACSSSLFFRHDLVRITSIFPENLSRDDFIPPVRKVAHLCHRLNSLPFLTGEFSDLSVEVVKHLQGCRPEPGGVH